MLTNDEWKQGLTFQQRNRFDNLVLQFRELFCTVPDPAPGVTVERNDDAAENRR